MSSLRIGGMRLEIAQCELCKDFVSVSENGPLTAHGHCKACAEPDELPCAYCLTLTDTYALSAAGLCPGCEAEGEGDEEAAE